MVRRMALPKATAPSMTSRPALRIAAAVLLATGLGLTTARAQEPTAPAPTPMAAPTPTIVSPPNAAAAAGAEPLDPSLSPECRVPGSKLYTLAKLRAVKAALKE